MILPFFKFSYRIIFYYTYNFTTHPIISPSNYLSALLFSSQDFTFSLRGAILLRLLNFYSTFWIVLPRVFGFPWECSVLPRRSVIIQMAGEGRALSSDTQPNLLQAWQDSLWDATCDHTGWIGQLNISSIREDWWKKNKWSRSGWKTVNCKSDSLLMLQATGSKPMSQAYSCW